MTETESEIQAGPFSEPSLLDVLRQETQTLEESKEVFIPISGYGKSGLAVKYHLPANGKELDDIATKMKRAYNDDYARSLNTAIATMVHLCGGLYVRPDGVEDYVMLDPDDTGAPLMFDETYEKAMGWEASGSSSAVVRRIFGKNDMAILNHAQKLQRWMIDTKADLNLEVWQLGG